MFTVVVFPFIYSLRSLETSPLTIICKWITLRYIWEANLFEMECCLTCIVSYVLQISLIESHKYHSLWWTQILDLLWQGYFKAFLNSAHYSTYIFAGRKSQCVPRYEQSSGYEFVRMVIMEPCIIDSNVAIPIWLGVVFSLVDFSIIWSNHLLLAYREIIPPWMFQSNQR